MRNSAPHIIGKLLILLAIGVTIGCQRKDPAPEEIPLPEFVDSPAVHLLATNLLHGASGMADAMNFSDAVWVHNDHDPQLFLLGYDGTLLKTVTFAGESIDWEDMTSGPGPEDNVNYLYIAETGDNAEIKKDYFIYRFPEPTEGQERIEHFDTIHFNYPDGQSFDVETLLLDPKTRDLYLLTKRHFNEANLFRLPYPQNTSGVTTAEFVRKIPYGLLTSGDISRDGKEILLKNYVSVYYWRLRENETIVSALSRPHDLSPTYVVEPQGEAIAFDKYSAGFFTISEKGNSPDPVKLYYYSKKANPFY